MKVIIIENPNRHVNSNYTWTRFLNYLDNIPVTRGCNEVKIE